MLSLKILANISPKLIYLFVLQRYSRPSHSLNSGFNLGKLVMSLSLLESPGQESLTIFLLPRRMLFLSSALHKFFPAPHLYYFTYSRLFNFCKPLPLILSKCSLNKNNKRIIRMPGIRHIIYSLV